MRFIIKEKGKVLVKNIELNDCCLDNLIPNQTEKYFCYKKKEFRRRGVFKKGDIEVLLCINEAVDSTRIWKSKAILLYDFIEPFKDLKIELSKDFITITDRLTHNLKKYNAHCIQASENILDPYSNSSGTKSQIDTIKSNLTQNVSKSSSSLLKIIKNNKLIQAELSVYDRLYKFNNEKLEKLSHSIHRLIKATLSAFWDSFIENNVIVEIENCYDEVNVDYETITVALVHLIDNCSKYTCPHSTLYITFSKLNSKQLIITLKMLSLRIYEYELDQLFNEGFSGELSCYLGLKGSGTGMYIIKNFVELNGGVLNLKTDTNRSKNMKYNGIEYEENIFEIILPLT